MVLTDRDAGVYPKKVEIRASLPVSSLVQSIFRVSGTYGLDFSIFALYA